MTSSKEHLTLTHKIRKPLVEKLRRERINSSIEQLKSLLGPEFLKQEPDAKMEKADILEMTVDFVRQHQLYRHGNSCSSAANQGHSRCVQEMVHFLSKDEIRKPLVEKLRRERINSSIEQLKSLLGPEFLKQEPDAKMEKADILEMTVDFVRQHQLYRHRDSCSSAANQGHSRCVQEMVHFLSKDEVKTQSSRRLLHDFQNLQSFSDSRLTEAGSLQLSSPLQPSITKEKSSVHSAPWRPW
ncbi:hypothetical protein CRUP_029373 [Coryphaenoides rupestris]|nr:hypothetical protein CRUP_029373 [Coryphaenoides rupestris]